MLAGLVGLGYLVFVCPGIFWRDAGELSAAAYGLGVAHPTGFPLYLLMAKAATFLPLGSVALRINLLSGVCAAASVGLAYSLMVRLAGDRTATTRAAASASALLLGCGSTLWMHATTAEVYAPNLLATLLLVLILLKVADEGSTRLLRMAAVLTGLGAGLHAAFALMAAAAWTVALTVRWSRTQREARAARIRQDLVWSFALGAAGAVVLAYLPIRAAQDPWRNWGDPSTVDALWAHLTGARIREAFGGEMGGGGAADINLEMAVGQLGDQVSWVGFGAVLGILVLGLTRPIAAAMVMGVFLADLAFTVLLNPMGMHDLQTGVPTTTCTVLAAGVGFAWLGKRLVRPQFGQATAAFLLFVGVFGLATPAIFSGGRMRDNRRLYHPTEQADRAFDRAPPRSLLLVSSDDMASGTTYLQGVENQRPDCLTVVKQHVADPVYIAQLHRVHGDDHLTARVREAVAAGRTPRELLAVLLEENTARRPVFWELGDGAVDGLIADELRIDFPLARLYGPHTADLQGDMIAYRSRWRRLSNGPWPTSALRQIARSYSILGAHLMRGGPKWMASQVVGEAYLTYRDDPHVANNYAILLQQDGSHAQAENRFRQVIAMRPGYALAWFNLGTSLFHKGDRRETADAFAQAARLGADRSQVARALYYLAVLHANDGDYDLALLLLSRALPSLGDETAEQAGGMLGHLIRIVLSGN